MDDVRRISANSLYSSENDFYSQESILSSLNRFLKSMNNMNNTVLVPCKLYDVDVDDEQDGKSLTSLSSDDGFSSGTFNGNLYDYYQMLNEIKEEILWTNKQQTNDVTEASPIFQLKYHIQQLQQLLNQFTDVANRITNKYQSETQST